MRKFLKLFLTLCLTLALGLALVACGAPGPGNGGGEGGGQGGGQGGGNENPPAYSSITASEWATVIENSTNANFTGKEYINPSSCPFYEIDIEYYTVSYNTNGTNPVETSDSDEVLQIIALFDFYKDFEFSDLTFNDQNNTYSYASPVVINITKGINNVTSTGSLTYSTYTYSNIVIKLNSNNTYISEISVQRVRAYDGGSETTNLILKYENFVPVV